MENLDVNTLFRIAPSSSERLPLVERLLELERRWIGSPTTVLVQQTGLVKELSWEAARTSGLAYSLTTGDSIRIYGDRINGHMASLAVEEGNGMALYSLAVPLAVLSDRSFESIEVALVEWYRACTSYSECVVIAGPELFVDLASGFHESVVRALQDTSLITSIVASPISLPIPADFRPGRLYDGIAVYTHAHGPLRLGLE